MAHAATEWILAAATRAIAVRREFHLVLAGGRTPRESYRLLRYQQADWARWHIWYGDERCLPQGHPDRNSAMVASEWLDHVPVPAAQRVPISAELGPDAAAADYGRRLASVGDFDLALLGLGEDGHTASLFPGHDWGAQADSPDTLAVCGAPKPPPARVSLSASRLSRARSVLFLVTGAGKHGAVAAWRAGQPIPAASIHPREELVVLTESACIADPRPGAAG